MSLDVCFTAHSDIVKNIVVRHLINRYILDKLQFKIIMKYLIKRSQMAHIYIYIYISVNLGSRSSCMHDWRNLTPLEAFTIFLSILSMFLTRDF